LPRQIIAVERAAASALLSPGNYSRMRGNGRRWNIHHPPSFPSRNPERRTPALSEQAKGADLCTTDTRSLVIGRALLL